MSINLLPEKEKKTIKKDKNWKKVFSILVFVLIFFLVLALTLFLIRKVVENKIEVVNKELKTQRAKIQQAEIEDFQELTKRVNNKLRNANSLLKEDIKESEFIEKLIEEIPSSIYLTKISFNKKVEGKKKKKKTFVVFDIKGVAQTRENLFNFKESLEERKKLKEVNFHTFSWTEPKNAKFYLEFRTSKYSLN